MFCEILLRIISDSTNSSSSLPSYLEEDKLETVLVVHDGSYMDDKKEQQHLPGAVVSVVSKMTIGQKVLISEEIEEENRQGERRKGVKI